MYLSHLSLREFRAYHHLELPLPPRGIGLVGPNASGKSTLLEAIAMLATTRSPRTSTEREVINTESGRADGLQPHARIVGTVNRDDEDLAIAIGFQLESCDDPRLRKQITINGRPVRAMDAVGTLRTVLFSPTDVELVSGSPSIRRRYLDMLISQVDQRFLRALNRYVKILEHRNGLLRTISRGHGAVSSSAAHEELDYWNRELSANGSIVAATRLRTIWLMERHASKRMNAFSEGSELALQYQSTLDDWGLVAERRELPAEQVEGVIAQLMESQIAARVNDELRRGVTLTGPHRDDFSVILSGRDVAVYGSRGQQRLAVIALKLAEADTIHEATADQPVILLDDVMSELDEGHRTLLNRAVASLGAQTILTSTDLSLLNDPSLDLNQIASIEDGSVRLIETR